MTNFGGWVMPLQYSSIREEHVATRQAAGLFDLSHMGELRIDGTGARGLVQRLVSRDIERLPVGRVQYAMLCNDAGGILDDLLVYVDEGAYLLVVNAGNQDRDYAWVADNAGPAERADNIGRQTALIGIQGPQAAPIVQELADRDLSGVRYYQFVIGTVGAVPCRISRTGYTGEDGFELYCAPEHALALWAALLEHGRDRGLKPAGLGARDTLRLEAGLRLYGNDMDEQTNPLEAGLDWTVTFSKDFIGRAALLRAKEAGLSRILVGLKMLDRSIPRHGYPVEHDGRAVGVVTSGNVSFSLGYNIALAYVPVALRQPGTPLAVTVRGVAAPAEVVPLPFYQRPHPK
jgi:aminomethyltransferase